MDRQPAPIRLVVHAIATGLFAILMLAMSGCGDNGTSTPTPNANAPAAPAVKDAKTLTLIFTYSSEKKAWLTAATSGFNALGKKTSKGNRIIVDATPMGSGEAIDEVLEGRRQVDLISPASAAFIKQGNAAWRAKNGGDLIGSTENLVLSPVVIAMWKPMAEALGWPEKPVGWAEILALTKDPKGWGTYSHAEWGRFKFGHTHPQYSNSGLITTLAIVYAASGKTTGLTLEDVAKPTTASFVNEIETAVPHYGSSTGFFADRMLDSGPSYLSAAVLYESSVIESYAPRATPLPFPVVAIYPKEGTFWSDHPVGIVQQPWVTPERQEAARAYIAFLMDRPQQEKAMALGFRPGDPAIPLGAPIIPANGVDPKEPKTTLEVPSPEIMEAINRLWHQQKKKANIVLVFDTSGSMSEEQKLVNAQGGAAALMSYLDDEDSISLLPFSTDMTWVMQGADLRTHRDAAAKAIQGLVPQGETRLYDSIDAAYQYLLKSNRADRINAVVVLTDGEDNKSTLTLPQLLGRVHSDSEGRAVRVFTIGYGHDAREDVLQNVAKATQAKYYKGTPQNIREVFKEIATFF